MKRWLKYTGIGLGVLVVLLISLLAWIIYTEAGLRFAVARLPERMGKVTLKIEDVSGTIAGGFSAGLVDVDHERSHVRVEKGTARVNFWPLLVGRIAAESAMAESLLIEVRPRLQPPPDTPMKFLPRLLSISAERANVRSMVIVAPSGKRVEFTDAGGAGVVRSRLIRVYEGNIVFGVLRGRAIGELGAGDPMTLRGEVTARLLIEGQPEWRADASFAGDLEKLPIDGKLQVPFRADFDGSLLALSTAFHWEADAKVHNFDLRAFGGGDALGIISGKLRLGGEMAAFHARGPLAVPGLGAGPFDMVFEGNYADRVVHATHYEITHRATGSHLEGAGTIEPADGGPRLVLYGPWRALRWPLDASDAEPDIFSSRSGEYRLQGIWPYAIAAEGELTVPQLAPMTLAVRGSLAKDHLSIANLDLGAFGGTARLAGEARWNPAESWALAGSVKGLDPATLRPGFGGALDFDLTASGAPFGADGALDVSFANLKGKLRGNNATGRGRFVRRGDDWLFEGLRFSAGGTRLAIDGELGARRNLDFRLDADDLALFAADARGALHAAGKISGTADAPSLRLTASGSDIQNGGLKVSKLAAEIDLDWRGQRGSHADVAVSNLEYDGRVLTQFNATLDGTTGDHLLKMDALATHTSLHLNGKGAFAEGVWRGMLTHLVIDDTANLNLQLDAPVAVMASQDAFKLDALCLRGKVARLCADGEWTGGVWRLRASANNLPISALTAGLTPKVEYQGTLNAAATASSTGGAPFIGEARADLLDAAIKHRLASGRQDVIRFGSGFITVHALPEAIESELRLDAAARGLISGRLRAERVGPDALAWPLRGQLNMATGELGFITLYLPEVDRAAGHFEANLAFDGNVGRPRASGVVKLTRGELDFYQMNLALRALDLEARMVSNNLEFSAAAQAGAGKLASSGRIEWRDGLPFGTLALQGDSLRVVDVPEARIDASPDLEFRIAGRDIFIKGEIKVPLARIEPADLTNAVLPSADEVLVTETEAQEGDPFRVTTELTMTLGERVRIETYGLSGHITGSITERSSPGQPSRAQGELQVKDGQYTALARKLDIERGRLIFNGGLLADPAVDIRAVKVFPDVKAGVNVRGSLREPRLSFFSEPSYPQSQIVSLLLAGGGLQSAQDANRQGSPAARTEVVGQAAALLAAQLGSKLGIPDISVESNLDNETSLVLGKYLSPRLYVSYGISLAESINTIQMRYTIDDRWTIKTEAGGKDRGADLVYTIEK